jgi:hypothetical protein
MNASIGTFAPNPSSEQENWVLQDSDFPAQIVTEGPDSPDENLFPWIEKLLKDQDVLLHDIKSQIEPNDVKNCVIHFLYVKSKCCFFDVESEDGIIEFKFDNNWKITRLP